MSHKRSEKTIDAHVWEIERRGTDGIRLTIVYNVDGNKHTTNCVRNFNLSFCDMERMGVKFHVIMDQLTRQWHETKKAISGK